MIYRNSPLISSYCLPKRYRILPTYRTIVARLLSYVKQDYYNIKIFKAFMAFHHSLIILIDTKRKEIHNQFLLRKGLFCRFEMTGTPDSAASGKTTSFSELENRLFLLPTIMPAGRLGKGLERNQPETPGTPQIRNVRISHGSNCAGRESGRISFPIKLTSSIFA